MPTLTLPAELESLEPLADLVLEQAALAGLDERQTYQLRLAVDEIATNIVVHGYQEHGAEGEIVAVVKVDEESLTVTLEDSAAPYDPLDRDMAEVEAGFRKPLEERQIGGLGVYFAIRAVHDFRYEWRNGRNRNIFVVHRPGTVKAAQAAQKMTAV
jgi:serine/threonine-protein kinase RsbW